MPSAGVEVLKIRAPVYLTDDGLFDGYGNDGDADEDLVIRSQQIARNLARCPDLNPSTVVDDKLLTAPIKPGDSMSGIAPGGITDYPNLINTHTTRLVTYNFLRFIVLRDQVEAASIDPTGARKPLLHAVYPKLSEIVLLLSHATLVGYHLAKTLLGLLDDGYKVVLVGYQKKCRNREEVKKAILDSKHAPRPVPNLDQLVNVIVDRTPKMTLREYYALPYVRCYLPSADLLDHIARAEKDYCRRYR